MRLKDALEQLDKLDRSVLICSKRPWTADADTLIVVPDESLRVPAAVKEAGFEYFLDVPTAREVLGVFAERPTTADERFRLLLHYAECDAYPEWVYDE